MMTATTLLTALALAFAAPGCGGKDDPKPGTDPNAPMSAADPDPTPGSDETPRVDTIANGYEIVRDALAKDDLERARKASTQVAKVAGEAEPIRVAAASLGGAQDIAAARLAFGELSKAYLAWLVANPDSAKGLHAFRCPMAKGYQKWVQRTETMENPYMGQKMLECGGPTELAP